MAFKIMTRIDKKGWGKADDKASSMHSDFMYLYNFGFERNNEWHLKQTTLIPTKLTKTSLKPSSK